MQLNFDGKTIDQVAIERIQTFEPPEGYWLAFSGGKDSVVLLDLTKRSGVKFEPHYNVTGIDPPELVKFIRVYHPEVIRDMPEKSIWKHIEHKGLPTRVSRWCCEVLKERGGQGRFVLTGIRAEESSKRRNRPMVQNCVRGKGKRFLHPIIDWKVTDIWQYIREFSIPYCELYDKGYKRLGCIGCPMSTHRKQELEAYPKIRDAWYRAMCRNWENKNTSAFKTPDDFWNWWLGNQSVAQAKEQDEAIDSMFV